MNPSYPVCLVDCKLSLMLVEDTQSIKNVCIYIINIVMYMFSSFSYDMIAIYFSSLHQNIFLWEKLFILGWSDTFANDCKVIVYLCI